MKLYRNIVISGASSGIGEALALDYAAPGVALALNGRDNSRLQAVADICRAKGATVEASAIDVTDRAALTAWLVAFDDIYPVDLLIANAGISIDKANTSLPDLSIVRTTMAVNFDGILNTVEPLLGRLMARRQGQIVLVSSLSGFIGLPYSAAYNASKGAVRLWGESIRYVLKKNDVGVTVVCPGFVVSRISANSPFKMPFMMSAERASSIIRKGLAHDRARIAFPLPTKAAIWLGSLLPGNWTARFLGA